MEKKKYLILVFLSEPEYFLGITKLLTWPQGLLSQIAGNSFLLPSSSACRSRNGSQATRRGERLAGRGTNAWAYGAFCASLTNSGCAPRLAVPCCFLINFSSPLAVAKDERNGSPDSTSGYLAGPLSLGFFFLPPLTRCESALVDLCLARCGNWGGAIASPCSVCNAALLPVRL